MWTAFPPSDYYANSATPRAHQLTSRLTGSGHRHTGAPGALPTFTMIRLTGSATGCTATAHPRGTRSIPAATDDEHRSWPERAAVMKSGIVAVDGPCPPGFGPLIVSSGFYHRIAFALPFGLASTHAGVWQYRPAVTLSGRLTSGARFHASAVPSFTRPLHQPRGRHPSRHGRDVVILHLLSHGASWRSHDYYGSSATSRRQQRTVRLPRTHQHGLGGHRRDVSHVHSYAGRQRRRPAVPRGHRRALPQHGTRPHPPNQQRNERDGPQQQQGPSIPTAHSRQFRGCCPVSGLQPLVSVSLRLSALLPHPVRWRRTGCGSSEVSWE